MDIFTVSLFGHREIDDYQRLDSALQFIINDLIKTKPYVNFLIGRNGEFDIYAASVIKSVQSSRRTENSALTLVLPYNVADIKYYEKYYDDIIIPEDIQNAHPKAAITLKNRWMVENSDLAIFCVERTNGGAYAAMRYAKKLNKPTVNIYERYRS